jgi:hypothetical protein
MLDILKTRQETESLNASPSSQPIAAHSLSSFFDACKSATSMQGVKELAKQHDVDFNIAMELAKHITSPSVRKIDRSKGELEDTLQVRCFSSNQYSS